MKKTIISAIKWLVSIGLMSYLISQTDLSEVMVILADAKIGYLVAAFLLCFVGYFISSNRWRMLMSLTGKAPSIFYLMQSFMVSMFFNNLLPSTIGGDASRTVDTWRVNGNKAKSFAVVFLDRFFGVYALFIYSSLSYLFFHNKIALPGLDWFILIGVITASLFLLFIIFRPFNAETLGNLLGFLPSKWRAVKTEIITTFYQIAGNRKTLISALSLSFLLQMNVVLHYYLITQALSIDIPLSAMFMIVPVALIIMMAPISVNGIGIRETVFVLLLGMFAVSKELALSFSFVVFIMIILQGLIGGLMFLIRKVPEKSNEAEQSPENRT